MSDVQHDLSSAGGMDVAAAVGAQLRRAREARGETPGDVALALKLTGRQIEAMEAGRLELLPGAAFARGFLRNYARYLGFDPAVLLADMEPVQPVRAVELDPVSNAEGVMPTGRRLSAPAQVPFALFVVALLVFLGGWYFDWFRLPGEAEEASEPEPGPVVMAPVAPGEAAPGSVAVLPPPLPTIVPADAAPVTAPSPAPVAVPAPASAPVAAPVAVPAPGAVSAPAPALVQPSAPAPVAATALPPPVAAPVAAPEPAAPAGVEHLQFRFAGEAWVEVRDAAGAIVYSGMNAPGTSRTVQGRAPFALVIGNAREVTLEYRGKPYDLTPHVRVSVARLKLE